MRDVMMQDHLAARARPPRSLRSTRAWGLGVLAAFVLGAITLLFLEIDDQLDRHNAAQTDNVTWTISRIEVEFLKLDRAVRALLSARHEGREESLRAADDVALAFDVFYARVRMVGRSPDLAHLPVHAAPVWVEIAGTGGFLDQTARVVDSGRPALVDAAPALALRLTALEGGLRGALLDALAAQTEVKHRWRADLRQALQVFAAVSATLVIAMAVMVATIHAQSRQRARHARMLEAAVATLRTTLGALANPVIVVGLDGRIEAANPAGVALAGEGTGPEAPTLARVLAPLDQGPGAEDLLQALADGRLERLAGRGRLRLRGLRRDGTGFPCEVQLAETRGLTGRLQMICFLRDLTEQEERERILTEARNAARRGEEAKARFLAVMSHEMRTPLNGLLSAADLIEQTTTLDDRQVWLLGIVRSCGRATLDQVNNVLELTRLGVEGGAGYTPAPLDLAAEMQAIVAQHEATAIRKGTRLALDLPEGDLPLVLAARPLLHRVVVNLLSNALKFTDGGEVRVSVTAQPAPSGVALDIAVRDTGIGIAEADLERVFRTFETLDASFARMREGSGLGLGIAKLSAEAMGGAIHVASRQGEGSVFTLAVTLPLAPEGARVPGAPAGAGREGGEAGRIERRRTDRRLADRRSQERRGGDRRGGEPAPTGPGVEGAAPRRGGTAPDAGSEAGAEAGPGAGSGAGSGAESGAGSGAPSAAPAPARAAAAEAAPDGEAPDSAREVLVVEDNAVNRRLLTELLRHRGHRVTGAMDGAVAVELAQARRFDAILMDVAMPRMDGLEATRRIREDSLCRDVPVIGVTANADPERIPEFHAAGMSLVLTKPIDIAAIDRAVRAGSGGAAGAGGPCARGPSAAGGVDAQGPGAEGVAADGAETGGAGRSAAPGGARAACGLDHARLTQLEEDLGRAALAGFLAAHDREVTAALDCHAGEAWGEAPAPPLPPGGDEPLHAASSAPRHRNGRGGGGAGSALAAEPGLAGAAADEGAGAGALAGKGAGAGSGASLGAASGASLGAASGPSLGAGPLPPPAADARGERLRAEAHRLSGAAATLGLQGLAALWAEVEARAAAGQPTTDMLRHLVLARAAAREGLAARGLAPAPQDTDAPSVRGPD